MCPLHSALSLNLDPIPVVNSHWDQLVDNTIDGHFVSSSTLTISAAQNSQIQQDKQEFLGKIFYFQQKLLNNCIHAIHDISIERHLVG